MLYAVQFILSFFSSAGFGILFNAPRRTIFAGGLSGAFGWLMYFTATQLNVQAAIASFLGAIVLTAISIVSSRQLRAPIIIFITCGIIPLVPGGVAYSAMPRTSPPRTILRVRRADRGRPPCSPITGRTLAPPCVGTPLTVRILLQTRVRAPV